MDGVSRKSRLVVFLVLCLSIPSCCEGKQAALFVFGDSIFDPGNNNYIKTTTVYQANFSPYGESYFHTPTGRFTDGRLICDFIAEHAKLPLIPTYLKPRNREFMYGANFASGGSGALIGSHDGVVVHLQTQLRYFGNLKNHYRQTSGDAKSHQMVSNAVYLFSVGANDYVVYDGSYDHEQYVDMVIGNFTNAIKEIYKKGGRKFGFMTVPYIGCLPAIRVTQPGNACSKESNDIVRLHNKAFAKKLEDLATQLEGFMYAKFDYANSLDNIKKNPSKYGFKEGDTACCGSGPFRGIYSCGGMRGIKEYQLCENATQYLFFDSYHVTEVASRQLADLFWNGDSKVTKPYNLKTLFQREDIHSSSQMMNYNEVQSA